MLDLYAINTHLESKSGHVDFPLPATAKDGDRPSARNLDPKVDEPSTVPTLENSVNEADTVDLYKGRGTNSAC